ncbi:MAG: GNAT family N-acetyltransferase [Nitrososphaerales archaeon]
MNELISDLQSYQRKAAAHTRQTIAHPPFHLYIHPTDSFRYFNYAIPDEPVEALGAEQLHSLAAAFAERDRTLRFEFLHEYTPKLRGLLDALGVPLEGENPLLVCTPETWTAVPPLGGLDIRRLTAESPDEDLAASINVGSRGFGEETRPATPEGIADLRRRIGLGGEYFVARLGDEPVGVGAYTVPLDGFTELVGIATLPEYRRRGIAGAVTAEMTRVAFQEGVCIAFLTAADDDASRVYQRSGFRRMGTGLAYGEPD